MPNASARKRYFNAAELGLTPSNATTGVWTSKLASNKYTLNKPAAATTSVVNIAVPRAQRGTFDEDGTIATIKVHYSVATANLSAPVTAILNKLSYNSSDGSFNRAAVAQTLTFSGTNTVGTAIGDYMAIVTITTPTALADNESYVLSLTMNEAATSVLDINGMEVTYN